MSNVLERFQGLSGMEFYTNACNLRRELEYFLMNEKNVPKRHRVNYSYPIIAKVNTLIDFIVKANNIYPYTMEQVDNKKQIYQDAIDSLDIIYERLQGAMLDLWWYILNTKEGQPGYGRRIEIEKKLEKIGYLLNDEEKLLKGCKAKVKLLNRK